MVSGSMMVNEWLMIIDDYIVHNHRQLTVGHQVSMINPTLTISHELAINQPCVTMNHQ